MSTSRLLGRHLAIVGATGGGKSWSLAHLMEAVAGAKGRLVLLDATGEFHTLGALAEHWSLSASPPSERQCGHAYLPHREFSEQDRFAFLRPSSGVQLPKLRGAIRSLRLAELLGSSSPLVANGLVPKRGQLRAPIIMAEQANEAALNDSHSPFALKRLPDQLRHECVYENDLSNPKVFGGWNQQEISYCASLGSRVIDLLQTAAVIDVIDPVTPPTSVFDAFAAWQSGSAAKPISDSLYRISPSPTPFAKYLSILSVRDC